MAIVKNKIGDVAKYAAEAIDWRISTEIYSLIARVSPDVVKIHNDNSLSRTQRMNLQVGLVIKATSLPEVRNLKMELWSRLADKLELLDGMSS
jgi:phosphoribosylanthranilate isomerase